MATINYTKVPTKKDLVVELAKIHKIKNYKDKNVVELLFTILDETLESRSQRERALYSIYGKFKKKNGNTLVGHHNAIKECDCLYCLSYYSPKSLFTYDGPQNELVKKK